MKKNFLKKMAGRLAVGACFFLSADRLGAQANHWVFLPDLKMSSTGAFTSFPAGSSVTNCMGATTRDQRPGVLSNASGTFFNAYNYCGVYNASGGQVGTTGLDNLFTIPGNCKELWSVIWVDVWGPPHTKALKIYKYSAGNAAALSYLGETTITPTGTTAGSCSINQNQDVAVAALDNDGNRKIYATSGKGLVSWTVSPTGSLTYHGQIYTLPYPARNDVRMEVSADGKYVFMNACGIYGVMVYNTITNTLNTINVGRKISGFEFAHVYSSPRLYISSHQASPPVGGIEYYDLSNFSGPYAAFSYATQLVFGYTEIERAKNGRLYFAYNPGYASGTVSTAGTLYYFDPTAASTAVPTQVLNGSAAVNVNTYSSNGYHIQRQIDGENYNNVDYSASAGNVLINFIESNGPATPTDPPTDVFLCNNKLEMFTKITSYHTNYSVLVELGSSYYTPGSGSTIGYWTFTPNTAQPVGNGFSVYSSKTHDTIDLTDEINTLKSYTGNIRVTVKVIHCGQTTTASRVINIKNPINFTLYTRNNSCNKQNPLVKTLPIPDAIFSTYPCGAGWVGVKTAGINTPSFTGSGAITSFADTLEEVDNTTGARIALIGGRVLSALPTQGVEFDDWGLGSGYFLDNFPLVALNNRTFKYTMTVVANGCASSNFTYFKIARDASTTPSNPGPSRTWSAPGPGGRADGFDGADPEEPAGSGYHGLHNNALMNVTISPNPANDHIRIQFLDMSDHTLLTVFDNIGRMVIKATGLLSTGGKVNIKKLSPGIYYYSLNNNGKIYHGKFVKK